MNKKLLKQLVIISYKKGELDNEIISQIAEKLDRNQLKLYIQSLKNAERLRNVYVESPFTIQKEELNELKNIFPDKNIIMKNNLNLLAGAKITYNDDIFQMNLKNSLDTIIDNIENYD